MEEDKELLDWLNDKFGAKSHIIVDALEKSPGAQGGIHGAVAELMLWEYLINLGFTVYRIKEKPAGGFDEKKPGYKGDFLIKHPTSNKYYVVECKGLKTNAEFRSGETSDEYLKSISEKQAFNHLKKMININKNEIYEKGKKHYNEFKKKKEYEKNTSKKWPEFNWPKEYPGSIACDLTKWFDSEEKLKKFIHDKYINNKDSFTEQAFRERRGVFSILQSNEPTKRTDPETGYTMEGPLVSDFSILAVDLFFRYGSHKFVFANPNNMSHSSVSANHLYQNYTIDVLVPGIKDELSINRPWYESILDCIKETSPKTVEYDDSQLDHRYKESR